jgi:hypothetical protein
MEELTHAIFGSSPLRPDPTAYDDRGLAVVFVAHLEDALEGAISTHFKISFDEARRLFSYPTGPLAEFSAKIAIGYALGIYDARMRDDLRWIKDVRNAFAHVRFEIDFGTSEIQEAVAQLKFPGPMTMANVEVPAGQNAPIPEGKLVDLTARQRFTICVVALTQMLNLRQTIPVCLDLSPLYGAPPALLRKSPEPETR